MDEVYALVFDVLAKDVEVVAVVEGVGHSAIKYARRLSDSCGVL
jgi:hypothetical protein